MRPRKLNILITSFGYGGNGGVKALHPDVTKWLLDAVQKAKADPRVDNTWYADLADTPVTMCRNNAVWHARRIGADVLLMVDSDQSPDLYLGKDPDAVPFWEAAFSEIYAHYDRGPLVIGAPYVGPPPSENVYVFRWASDESDHFDDRMQIKQYTREEAVLMSGIHECAALPTGLIMCDVRAFELTEPKEPGDKPWFYYEYTDIYERHKASTEDCTATRDLSMCGMVKLGYNPVRCAWSSWIGHWKPKCCGRPVLLRSDDANEKYHRAVREAQPRAVKYQEVDFTRGNGHQLRPEHFNVQEKRDKEEESLDLGDIPTPC